MLAVGVFLACALGAALLVWAMGRASKPSIRQAETQRYEDGERACMPDELKSAHLVMNEALVRSRDGVDLGARVDQVFATVGGPLVLVETKRRRSLHLRRRDQVQLSGQRYVLLRSRAPEAAGKVIAMYGWVRIVWPGRNPTYRRVTLLPDSVIEGLIGRRQALDAGAQPWVADDTARCLRCRLRERCHVGTSLQNKPLESRWSPQQRAWIRGTLGWVESTRLIKGVRSNR